MTTVKRYIESLAMYMKGRSFPAALFSVLLALTIYGSVYQAALAAENQDAETAFSEEQNETCEEEEAPAKPVPAKSFPVYVVEGGVNTKVLVKGGTVADVLEYLDISLSRYDIVDIPLDAELESGDTVTITRMRYSTVSKRKKLPFETLARYSPEIASGKEKILSEGETGILIQTVKQTVADGVVTEEAVIDSEVEKEPVPREVLMGFPVKPVSGFDFGLAFDENCEPVGYSSVLRNQKSAGYSARSGAKTASGRDAIVGHVAVNPKVIPYGTRLFIKSSDGKHIYGYAIAADTGTALMDGRIAVDLLYNTYEESADHGIKEVDIFILSDE